MFYFWVWIWVLILIFFLVFLIYTQIHTQKLTIYFLYFKLFNSKFSRDSQNTQTKTQNPNTQKIENANQDFNLWDLNQKRFEPDKCSQKRLHLSG